MVKQIIWTNIQDTKLIDRLVKIADESDWWDNISEAERSSIERGLKDLDEGRFVDHSEARKLYEKYL
jgi:predicted transcriptional regulator